MANLEKPIAGKRQTNALAGKKAAPSTQRYLDIAEIKEDVVIMKDGTVRAVLLVSSINFALKSEDEQDAIISHYVGFLNSIDFPLQIVIQSRKLNIDDYLARLQAQEVRQQNELLRSQIVDYRNFIKELVTLGQIMQKQFFVIVQYNPLSDLQKSFWKRVKESISPVLSMKLADERFQNRKKGLMTRVNNILGGLSGMGLNAVMLDTQGLIELYYRVYNPELLQTEKMPDIGSVNIAEDMT